MDSSYIERAKSTHFETQPQSSGVETEYGLSKKWQSWEKMYTMHKLRSVHLRDSSRGKTISWFPLATTMIVLCVVVVFTTSFWGGLPPFSKPSAQAAAPFTRRVNVPYFGSNTVPFNQTALFWFGAVTSADTYTDVRIGYNKTELFIDLHTVDRYLWYDTDTSAPNLSKDDNASVYLNTTSTGSGNSYKFQTGVNGYKKRTNYQQAYTGSGTMWTPATIPFTAVYGWQGHGFNGPEDSGWSMTYHIPFSSLGLAGPPSQGTAWKLAVQVQNRDTGTATTLSEKWWPESANEMTTPSSWGQLVFGIPTYQPPHTSGTAIYSVRNKLNNQVVTDGMVGGSLSCGNLGLNRWTQWGTQGYPGASRVNIQNETYISDWNCFSKFYITFPLSSLPSGKGVVKATVTLYEYANAGVQGQPNPTYIQVATVNEDWNPATLSWNNAPWVQENINTLLVNTKTTRVVPLPGLAITWDVSRAVAQAYATGQPLRLVFYTPADQHDSGKYFFSSSIGDWNAAGRPTLQVTLGA